MLIYFDEYTRYVEHSLLDQSIAMMDNLNIGKYKREKEAINTFY